MHEDEVKNIVDKAVKEMSMEKIIKVGILIMKYKTYVTSFLCNSIHPFVMIIEYL